MVRPCHANNLCISCVRCHQVNQANNKFTSNRMCSFRMRYSITQTLQMNLLEKVQWKYSPCIRCDWEIGESQFCSYYSFVYFRWPARRNHTERNRWRFVCCAKSSHYSNLTTNECVRDTHDRYVDHFLCFAMNLMPLWICTYVCHVPCWLHRSLCERVCVCVCALIADLQQIQSFINQKNSWEFRVQTHQRYKTEEQIANWVRAKSRHKSDKNETVWCSSSSMTMLTMTTTSSAMKQKSKILKMIWCFVRNMRPIPNAFASILLLTRFIYQFLDELK